MLPYLDLLGKKVKDSITGIEGTVINVSYDLNGCIQAIIHPGLDKDQKIAETHWMDTKRLKVLDHTPVMTPPDFAALEVGEEPGPSEKPKFMPS